MIFFLSLRRVLFLCCTRFVACYTNCAEYRTTRRRENCLFKISCFTLRRWLRMQRYKRTRENRSRLRRRCRRDTKCYCARHADDDTSNRKSDERGLCHITETAARRAGKSFSSLCFHFEFSSATDNHAVERHLSSEPHSTINKKKKAKHEWVKNEIKKRLLNFFFLSSFLNIFFLVVRVVKRRRMKASRYKFCVLNVNIEVSSMRRRPHRWSKIKCNQEDWWPKPSMRCARDFCRSQNSRRLCEAILFENRVRKCKYITRDPTESEKICGIVSEDDAIRKSLRERQQQQKY